jgi:hypothetical protein
VTELWGIQFDSTCRLQEDNKNERSKDEAHNNMFEYKAQRNSIEWIQMRVHGDSWSCDVNSSVEKPMTQCDATQQKKDDICTVRIGMLQTVL